MRMSRVWSNVKLWSEKYNSVLWKVIFTVQLLALGIILFTLASVLTGGGLTFEEFHNTYCAKNDENNNNNNNNNNEVRFNGTNERPCEYDYNFKKIVYLWADGISWDTASPVFDVFDKEKENVFKVRHINNPWSYWIFATYMTGKGSRNMDIIHNDNLIYQFFISGMKLLLGMEDKGSYCYYNLDTSFLQGSDSIMPMGGAAEDTSRMYQSLFECPLNDASSCARQLLDRAKSEDRSMYFESFLLDHKVHNDGSKYGSHVTPLRDRLAEDLVHVRDWINDNPEYLLVIVSDHGQVTSREERSIHGDFLKDGNEGWLLLYNPLFDSIVSTSTEPVILNTVDVAPTVWQFFSANGVSIPAESIGKVYPITQNAYNRYKMLKANAMQIKELNKREELVEYPSTLLDQAEEYAQNNDYEQAAEFLDQYITRFRIVYYAEGGKSNYIFPMLTAFVTFFGTLAIQFGSLNNFFELVKAAGFGLMASPYIGWIIIALFFTQSEVMEARNQVYTYAVPLFIYLASYTAKMISKRRNKNDTRQTEKYKTLSVSLSVRTEYEHDEKEEENEEENFAEPEKVDDDEDEAQFVYTHLARMIGEKKYCKSILYVINHVIGNFKAGHSSLEYWLLHAIILFSVFACFEISFVTKHLIFSDIGGLYAHPPFWKSVALATLFMEFRWQRVILTTNLHFKGQQSSLKRLLHPAFMPLNLKMILYFAMLILSFHPSITVARVLYGITFIHIGVLMFCPIYIQRDLFLPFFILTFLLDSSQQRILQCMFVSILNFLCQSFSSSSSSSSSSTSSSSSSSSSTAPIPLSTTRHIIPLIVVTILSLGHYYFANLYRLPYTMEQIIVQVPGIEDITKYPNFVFVMMVLNYVAVFFLLIPFFVRLCCPNPPPLQPFKIGCFTFGHVPMAVPENAKRRDTEHYKKYVTMFLTSCSALSVFTFYLYSVSTLSDIPLVWCSTICIVSSGFGLTVVCSEWTSAVVNVIRKCFK